MTIRETVVTMHPEWPGARVDAEVRAIRAEALSVPPGPRDFSADVHSHFAATLPVPHITVHIYLSDDEADKVTSADVSAAVAELLARLGVDRGQVSVSGPEDTA